MDDDNIKNAVILLSEIEDDASIPKNLRSKIKEVMVFLEDEGLDLSIKSNKVVEQLDGIVDEFNVSSYTRTQIWSVVSLLESVE